jgi:hypothetical protein
MDVSKILSSLERNKGRTPRAALTAAAERRDEITPHLLRIIEEVIADPSRAVDDQDYVAHLYAMYLLASFRETRAYLPIVKLFSFGGETPFDIAGDVVTEDLGNILASVCGNETARIAELFENETANEYVRAAALSAMVTLVVEGQRSRSEVMEYFASLFRKLKRKPGFAWTTLAGACADLYPREVMKEIRKAYADRLIDTGHIALQDVEGSLAHGMEGDLESLRRHHHFISDDVAKETSWWCDFKERAVPAPPAPVVPRVALTQPVRTTLKIGRNDPCPCGSGKKYKKCCG